MTPDEVLAKHATTINFARQRVAANAVNGSYATSAEKALAALADAIEEKR